MACECWKKAALQIGEAVLLPAVEERPQPSDVFLPVRAEHGEPMPDEAVSVPARRGSMAGRGVLRAAGIGANPYALSRAASAHSTRPLLFSARGRLR